MRRTVRFSDVDAPAGSQTKCLFLHNHSLVGPTLRQLLGLEANKGVFQDLGQNCLGRVELEEGPKEWVQFLTGHVQAVVSASNGQWVDAYDYLAEVVPDWLTVFRADRTGWTKEPMRQVTLNLENFSSFADNAATELCDDQLKGVLAGKTLQNLFGAISKSKEREKKRVALHVANVIFKVYFRLNILQMCKNLMKTFQNASLTFEDFSLADRVTYKYYAGKLALVEQEYKEARAHLEYAYTWCTRKSRTNVHKILRCLIPLRMLDGILPTTALLRIYHLDIYADLATAMQQSNLGNFEAALKSHRTLFVKMDTNLLVERLRAVIYRQILRVVVQVHNESVPKERQNKVPLESFVLAVQLKGRKISMTNALCIMASMISQNYIKGYVSFSHKQLVLAPNPFPPFTEVQVVMEL